MSIKLYLQSLTVQFSWNFESYEKKRKTINFHTTLRPLDNVVTRVWYQSQYLISNYYPSGTRDWQFFLYLLGRSLDSPLSDSKYLATSNSP